MAFRVGRNNVDVGTAGSNLDTDTYNITYYATSPVEDDTKFIDTIIGFGKLKSDLLTVLDGNNLTADRTGNQLYGTIKIKDEIKKYNKELESVRTKADNSPDVKKMKGEREKIENEIIQKRKELDSGFRELKFIKDEMTKSSKSEGTEKIVDAASAVVASMNQKLQTTLTELNAVKKALEDERGRRKNST